VGLLSFERKLQKLPPKTQKRANKPGTARRLFLRRAISGQGKLDAVVISSFPNHWGIALATISGPVQAGRKNMSYVGKNLVQPLMYGR